MIILSDNKYMLFNGDCLDYMKQIADKSIDLILTDPPYNIVKYSTGNIELPNRSTVNNNLEKWDLQEIKPLDFIKDFIKDFK